MMAAFLSWAPTILTVLFALVFLAVLLFVVTDRRKQHHQRMASIPLDDAPSTGKERHHG